MEKEHYDFVNQLFDKMIINQDINGNDSNHQQSDPDLANKTNISEGSDDSNRQHSDPDLEVIDDLKNISISQENVSGINSDKISSNTNLSSQSLASTIPIGIISTLLPFSDTNPLFPPIDHPSISHDAVTQNIEPLPGTSSLQATPPHGIMHDHSYSQFIPIHSSQFIHPPSVRPNPSAPPIESLELPSFHNVAFPRLSPRIIQKYRCPDCMKVYSSFSLLSKHREFKCIYGSHPRARFKCFYCKKLLWLLEDNVGTRNNIVCCKNCRFLQYSISTFFFEKSI